MRDTGRVTGALLGAALVLAACGGGDSARAGDSGRFVALDGSPRVADDAGVVTAIDPDFATLAIDGERVYEIHDEVQSFASMDGTTLPLRDRLGQYVHVGVEDGTIVWVGSIGSVLRVEGERETVVYLGSIAGFDGEARQLRMRDGTVFVVADEVDATSVVGPEPDQPLPATLRIDVATDEVVEIQLAS